MAQAIAPTEDAASAPIRRRQACVGGCETASQSQVGLLASPSTVTPEVRTR